MRRVAYQTVAHSNGSVAEPLFFGGPGFRNRDHQIPFSFVNKRDEGGVKPTLRQTCLWPRPRAQFAFKDSMVHIICNSHYVSHFAAFFIVTGTKISVVESCLWLMFGSQACCDPLTSGLVCVGCVFGQRGVHFFSDVHTGPHDLSGF